MFALPSIDIKPITATVLQHSTSSTNYVYKDLVEADIVVMVH